MITFLEYLAELKIEIPKAKDTLGIERKDMPQIASKDYKHFLSYLKKNGSKLQKKTVDPNTLRPIQKQFVKAGIEKTLDNILADINKKPPIIVSSDNYIIDGHHRWLACKNGKKDIKITKVTNTPVKELLKLANGYERVTYKDVYK